MNDLLIEWALDHVVHIQAKLDQENLKWEWWDDLADTAFRIQTQDSKFNPCEIEAKHVTYRWRSLSTMSNKQSEVIKI